MAFDRRPDLAKNASVGVSCKCLPNINELSRLDEGIQKLLNTDDFGELMQCVSDSMAKNFRQVLLVLGKSCLVGLNTERVKPVAGRVEFRQIG
jgi:hypothetical protein